MAWIKVIAKSGNDKIDGMMKGDMLEVPNVFKDPKTIVIDKKSYSVLSSSIDELDNILKIQLAMASTKKEKSDDNPNEGRS